MARPMSSPWRIKPFLLILFFIIVSEELYAAQRRSSLNTTVPTAVMTKRSRDAAVTKAVSDMCDELLAMVPEIIPVRDDPIFQAKLEFVIFKSIMKEIAKTASSSLKAMIREMIREAYQNDTTKVKRQVENFISLY